MITYPYSLLMHDVYVYYTFLLAQLSNDVTFGVISDSTPTHKETEVVKETP